jgi:Flp pilus assembly pilin Flp
MDIPNDDDKRQRRARAIEYALIGAGFAVVILIMVQSLL